MHVKESGKKNADLVHMDWDQSQAALRTGNYEIAGEEPGDESTRSEKIVPDLVAPSDAAKPALAPASSGKDAKAS